MSEALQKYILRIPVSHIGDVLGELNHRGAWFDHFGQDEEIFTLEARAPEKQMADFEAWLKKISIGRGQIIKHD